MALYPLDEPGTGLGSAIPDYRASVAAGQRSIGRQQRAALSGLSGTTGNELAGLSGFGARGLGPGTQLRLRRAALQRGTSRIGQAFSDIGAQNVGREQDLFNDIIRRRVEARIRQQEQDRANQLSAGNLIGSVGGYVANRFLG